VTIYLYINDLRILNAQLCKNYHSKCECIPDLVVCLYPSPRYSDICCETGLHKPRTSTHSSLDAIVVLQQAYRPHIYSFMTDQIVYFHSSESNEYDTVDNINSTRQYYV